jgi:hypothetical protein
LETYRLTHHASFVPRHITGLSVCWSQLPDGRLMLRYKVEGCTALVVPPQRTAARADDLWTTTCCELFLYDGAGRYREYNFSPSGKWAAWRFSGYRNGREDIEPLAEPTILAETGQNLFLLTVFLAGEEIGGAEAASLSAVLMEDDRRPSYWALAHSKLQPDFHDPSCFRIRLGAAAHP